MSKKLAIPKGKKVAQPKREVDHVSKRGVNYWFAPDWVREVGGGYGRIKPIKDVHDNVYLYMLSKDGNLSCIRGSIQTAFINWHEDNEIDYILLGMNEDDILITDWDYKDL